MLTKGGINKFIKGSSALKGDKEAKTKNFKLGKKMFKMVVMTKNCATIPTDSSVRDYDYVNRDYDYVNY